MDAVTCISLRLEWCAGSRGKAPATGKGKGRFEVAVNYVYYLFAHTRTNYRTVFLSRNVQPDIRQSRHVELFGQVLLFGRVHHCRFNL